MPNQEVASTAKPEDTTGPKRPSEERLPELVDAVTSDTLLEKRRKGLRSWMALDGRGKSLKEIRIEKNEKSDEIIQNQYLKVKDN